MTLVHILVEVHKEPTNETPDWSPPSPDAVANFIQSRVSRAETDDGWFVSTVTAVEAEN